MLRAWEVFCLFFFTVGYLLRLVVYGWLVKRIKIGFKKVIKRVIKK